eukprot:PhM_4_TR16370/c0_g1_i1/m.77375
MGQAFFAPCGGTALTPNERATHLFDHQWSRFRSALLKINNKDDTTDEDINNNNYNVETKVPLHTTWTHLGAKTWVESAYAQMISDLKSLGFDPMDENNKNVVCESKVTGSLAEGTLYLSCQIFAQIGENEKDNDNGNDVKREENGTTTPLFRFTLELTYDTE